MKKTANLKYKGKTVLIFGASGRQAVPVIKGFYDLGCNVTAYCASKRHRVI
jgi:Fe2+ transport system protein B